MHHSPFLVSAAWDWTLKPPGYNRERSEEGGDDMPIHDWTRLPGGLFHHFHQDWSIEIARN